MKKWLLIDLILLPVIFILFPSLWSIGAFRPWFPPLASKLGGKIDQMVIYTLIVVVIFMLVGHLFLSWFIVRFGRQKEAETQTLNPKAETLLAVGISLLMAVSAEGGAMALARPVWKKLYIIPPPSHAIQVEITAQQWDWLVRYPGPDGVFGKTNPKLISFMNPLGIVPSDPAGKDDLVLKDEMVLPVNHPAVIYLRSMDVIHSLDLPNFRIRQDATPGMTIRIWFTPTKKGIYPIACSQICGRGHYLMQGKLKIVSYKNYQEWLQKEEKEVSGRGEKEGQEGEKSP